MGLMKLHETLWQFSHYDFTDVCEQHLNNENGVGDVGEKDNLNFQV